MDGDKTRRSVAEQLSASLLVLLDAAAERLAQRVLEKLERHEAIRDQRERDNRHRSGWSMAERAAAHEKLPANRIPQGLTNLVE